MFNIHNIQILEYRLGLEEGFMPVSNKLSFHFLSGFLDIVLRLRFKNLIFDTDKNGVNT